MANKISILKKQLTSFNKTSIFLDLTVYGICFRKKTLKSIIITKGLC